MRAAWVVMLGLISQSARAEDAGTDEPAVSAGAEDAGIDEPLRFSAAATGGVAIVAQPFVTAVADQLSVAPMIHGTLRLERESGPFLFSAKVSLLASNGLPLVNDLGSHLEASVRLHPDAKLAVRVVPFAPRQLLRVPFDFANDFGWPSVFGESAFAPMFVVSVGADWWHVAVSGAVSVARTTMGPAPRPREAEVPRVVTELGVERERLRVDLRAGVIALERKRFAVAPPGRLLGALRVGWRTKDLGRPIDFVTYRADPDRFSEQFAALPEVAWGVESEVELGAADATRGGLRDQTLEFPWYVQVRLAGMLLQQRLFATLRVRTAAQVVWKDAPDSLMREELETIQQAEPAVILQLATDRRVGPLTLGAGVRLARPALQFIKERLFGLPDFDRWTSGVDGLKQDVPVGAPPAFRVGLKATARLDLGPHVTLLAEFDFDTLPAQPVTLRVPMPADRQTITAHVFAQVR